MSHKTSSQLKTYYRVWCRGFDRRVWIRIDCVFIKMFKLYKGELKRGFTPLYYTLLDWEDKHKHDPFISKYGMNDDGFLRR